MGNLRPLGAFFSLRVSYSLGSALVCNIFCLSELLVVVARFFRLAYEEGEREGGKNQSRILHLEHIITLGRF